MHLKTMSFFLIHFLLCVLTAQGATVSVSANATTGKLMKPENFFAANKDAINAVVGGGQSAACAVFIFDLYETGGSWTDIKFKVSTNGFKNASAGNGCVLYMITTDPARQVHADQIYNVRPTVYFINTKNTATDGRAWILQGTQSIAAQVGTGKVVSIIVVVPIDATINPSNAALSFSWCRLNAQGTETVGGNTVWRAAYPTWASVIPSP